MTVTVLRTLTKPQAQTAHARIERDRVHAGSGISGWGPARLIASWRRRFALRQELSRLSPRDLDDLGLSGVEIADEIRKPFWRK